MKTKFQKRFNEIIHKIYPDKNATLHKACLYALEGPGKKIRPILTLMTHELFDKNIENAFLPAIAIEMIHTYSLVHDDLPAMDDDSLRRGRPTVHTIYGEGTAILVGDALLSDAFALLSGVYDDYFSQDARLDADTKIAMLNQIAKSVGSQGMVLGQSLDLESSKESSEKNSKEKKDASVDKLLIIHKLKTSELISSACTLGFLSANPRVKNTDHMKKIADFGSLLGLAFQMKDDLLDETQGTGKSQGKDKEQNKLTFLSHFSKLEVEALVDDVSQNAFNCLNGFLPESSHLMDFARSLINRTY